MARPASVELENKNRFWSKRKTDPLSKKGGAKSITKKTILSRGMFSEDIHL